MNKHARTPRLEDIPLQDALSRWFKLLSDNGLAEPLGGEYVALHDAANRVTAEPLWAEVSSPHFHACAMDGYAVHAESTSSASETHPIQLRLGSEAYYVDTGDPLPATTNAVIMLEDVQCVSGVTGDAIEISSSVAPWRNVRLMGEDMVATELILPTNHELRPQDLGAAAGSGHALISVRRQPRVAVQPTGTELVPPGAALHPGDIVEYNSIILGALVESWGAVAARCTPLADDYHLLRDRIVELATTHDLVIVNAGTSAGSEDFTARIGRELGEVVVHGIALRPGHPVILGIVRVGGDSGAVRSVPFVGLPGYPVSAAVTCELVVKPLISLWLGRSAESRPMVDATLTCKVTSPAATDHFVRVTVGQVGEKIVATPLPGGSSVLMSLVRADGCVHIQRDQEVIERGVSVPVELYRSRESLRRTIVAMGSHDLALDLIADEISTRFPGRRLSSANVGSAEGLRALKNGEAHLAGCHLLDEKTGEYNTSSVRESLPGIKTILLGLVEREQGFIVPRGNPKGIRSLRDLINPEVTFANRQKGSGTRALLDLWLGREGISGSDVKGYERQHITHMAVAAAVSSGVTDCGLGIRAAARALGLDFVPLVTERYDLVIPVPYYESDILAPLLSVVRDRAFARRVVDLGGYATPNIGSVLAELP